MQKLIPPALFLGFLAVSSYAGDSRLYRPPPSPVEEEDSNEKPRLGDIPDEDQKKAAAAEAPRKQPDPKSATAAKSGDKPRLGDIPEESEKTAAESKTADPKSSTIAAEKTGEKPRLGDMPNESKDKKDKKNQAVLEGMTPEERKKLLEEVAEEFYEKGEMAYQEGRMPESRDYLERVLTLQPNHAAARRRLEMVIRILEPAEPEPKPAPPVKDSKLVLLNKLSVELDQAIKVKEWDRAERVAKNILAVDPSNERAKARQKVIHQNLALRAADRAAGRERAGDFQGAVDAYRVAVNYNHDPAYTDKIESLLEKINEANDRKSDELYRQALDASQNGHMDKAIDLCKEALQLNPDNIQAERMLDRLESRIPS